MKYRSVSTIQGRPLGFRDETFDVRLPELLPRSDIANFPLLNHNFSSDVLNYAIYHFKLHKIISNIKVELYLLPVQSAQSVQTVDPKPHQIRIMAELQTWLDEVFSTADSLESLDQRHKLGWCLKMKVRFHAAVMLLFQPSQAIPRPSEDSLRKCYDSAGSVLQIYQVLHDNHCLHHGWRTVQGVFAAGATLLYTFWTSKLVQQTASVTELSINLRTCSNLLSVGGEWWPSVKKGRSSLEAVVDLTIRKLYSRPPPAKQRRIAGRSSNPGHEGNHAGTVTGTNTNRDQDRAQDMLGEMTFPGAGEAQALPSPYDETSMLGGLHGDNFDFAPNTSVYTTSQPNLSATDQWRQEGIGPFPSPGSTDIQFRIDDFLADFENSDFNWSIPLTTEEEQVDFNQYFTALPRM